MNLRRYDRAGIGVSARILGVERVLIGQESYPAAAEEDDDRAGIDV